MASLSSEVASMSVADSSLGDNLTAWKVVDGDHREDDYFRGTPLLSIRSGLGTATTLIRDLQIGDVFVTVGAPTILGCYTCHQLEDGSWISSTIGDIDGKKIPMALQISADVYAKKKAEQDAIEEKKELEANDEASYIYYY